MLRSADAANVDAVLIANPKSDLYNSNIIRSSIGCVFTNQIATGTSEEIIAYCSGKLAKYKLPTQVEFIEELPKTNVGKVLRKDLRARELAQRS